MATTPAEERSLDWLLPPSDDELVFFTEEPVESDYHRDLAAFLIALLRKHLGATSFVGGNQAIYYSETQARNRDFLAPDVFAIVGDTTNDKRLGWVMWREDGRAPDLIVEILSPSTEHVDRGKKRRLYERTLRVPEYYLFDPVTGGLEGLQLTPDGYTPISPNADGRLPSKVLGLSVGVAPGEFQGQSGPWVRLFLPDGRLLLSDSERAEEAAQRAEQAAQRAEQEAQRAEQEAQRAADLAARLAAYEARFGSLDDH